ncbi:MAG: hypothetical protein NW201_07315 [Gemmatimonadales bacterium]|nr:hypothetical protein [Gemmatimonadales bacterium]
MGTAVLAEKVDYSDLPHVLNKSVVLGIITCVFVVALSFGTRFLEGPAETAVCGALVALGIALHVVLPAIWVNPRTVEGISGAAGIGLGASVVYLLVDVTLLQNIGIYTNRWAQIGGGSNWWYHPVWWQVGCYISWLGAFIWANQAERGGTSAVKVISLTAVCTVVCGVVAAASHFPAAGWNYPTFGVASLPGLALATLVSSFGEKRA